MKTDSTCTRPAVGIISLGCAKNLVDSEIMLGALASQGYPVTSQAEEADVLIVNTCSFIESAKEESIAAIFEANRLKGLRKRERTQKLIVAGCMAQRFRAELPEALPEADAFIGLDQVGQVAKIVGQVWEGEGQRDFVTPRPRYIPDWDTPRLRLTPAHFAYLKIAEGCNHPCSFCVIPQMRGRHRSRTIDSVVREAAQLVEQGVREINLISQDTTYFGMDHWEQKAGPRQPVDSTRGESLAELLRQLDQVPGDFWVRVLYTHPAHWSDELIETISVSKKVARYVDIPLQHIHGDMLSVMRRETSEQHILDLIARLRAGIAGLAIRTTFIVGFPGEKPAHFQRLLDFIEDARFERLGIFPYSKEEGTKAAGLSGHTTEKTKRSRFEKAMELQRRIASEIAQAQIGTSKRILVEAPGRGRTEWDAPEIDGAVYCSPTLPVGCFANVSIQAATDYDLVAEGGTKPKSSRVRAQAQ